MKMIPLTQGKVAYVSSQDYRFLSRWKWYYLKDGKGHGGYAAHRSARPAHTSIRMHWIVAERMGLQGRVDHRNQNGLDNRRCNLRRCSLSQNQGNSRQRKNNTSGYRGVSWCKRTGRWFAQITVNGKNRGLGQYLTKLEAASAYNKAAKSHFGKFAMLNKVP